MAITTTIMNALTQVTMLIVNNSFHFFNSTSLVILIASVASMALGSIPETLGKVETR